MPVLSKVSTSPAIPSSTALIVADTFLRQVLDRSLHMNSILSYTPSHLDFIPIVDYGSLSYRLKPELASALWLELIQRARIILCAANDFNPYAPANVTKPLPTTICLAALQQLNISWPVVGLSYLLPGHNPLLNPSSRETLFSTFRAVQHAARWYSDWIFNVARHTVTLGPASRWNFGAYFGYRRDEFLVKAGPGLPSPMAHSTYSHASTANTTLSISDNTSLMLHPTASLTARTTLVTDALTMDSDPPATTHPFRPELSGAEIVQIIAHEIEELDK
jgi:hypothetical protein